jgi:hypothetical protein
MENAIIDRGDPVANASSYSATWINPGVGECELNWSRAGQIGARPAVPHDKSAVNESIGQGEKIVRRPSRRVTCAAASQSVLLVMVFLVRQRPGRAVPPVFRERRQKKPSRSGGSRRCRTARTVAARPRFVRTWTRQKRVATVCGLAGALALGVKRPIAFDNDGGISCVRDNFLAHPWCYSVSVTSRATGTCRSFPRSGQNSRDNPWADSK